MKNPTMIAAGAVAAMSSFAVTPASAQHREVHERTVVRHDDGPRMHHRQV